MPYIGKQPLGGAYHKLDSLTASATDTYALTLGSAAYYPGTANQLLVSLNNVIQAPQDDFTVLGSNLVFDSALTASDSIDFVVALGDVLDINTPSDGTITTAKLSNNAVTTAKIGNNAVTGAKLASTLDLSDKTLTMPTGAVLQVKYTIYDTASSIATNANTTTTLTNLQVDITPSATNSIIRLDAMVNGEFSSYGYNFNSTWFFLRDSTKLSAPAAGSRTTGVRIGTSASFSSDSSSTPDGSYFTYFDSAHSTTSAITYSVGVNTHTAATWYENRTVSDSNTFEFERGISFICATEIAG